MTKQDEWCDYSDLPKAICSPHCHPPSDDEVSLPYPQTELEKATAEANAGRRGIKAQYSTICMSRDCGEQIEPGDYMHRAPGGTGWLHAECS